MPNVANEAKAVQKMGLGAALVVIALAGTLAAAALGIWAGVVVAMFRLVAQRLGVPL